MSCRNKMCRVRLRHPSRATAKAHGQLLLCLRRRLQGRQVYQLGAVAVYHTSVFSASHVHDSLPAQRAPDESSQVQVVFCTPRNTSHLLWNRSNQLSHGLQTTLTGFFTKVLCYCATPRPSCGVPCSAMVGRGVGFRRAASKSMLRITCC